jgi:hypothetical protein
MAIHFCGEITIDNYEFYGRFDGAIINKAVKRHDSVLQEHAGAVASAVENFSGASNKAIAPQVVGVHDTSAKAGDKEDDQETTHSSSTSEP